MGVPGSAGLPTLAGEDHVCADCGMSYDSDLDAALGEVDAHVAGFLDEIAATTDWDRTATRRPGDVV